MVTITQAFRTFENFYFLWYSKNVRSMNFTFEFPELGLLHFQSSCDLILFNLISPFHFMDFLHLLNFIQNFSNFLLLLLVVQKISLIYPISFNKFDVRNRKSSCFSNILSYHTTISQVISTFLLANYQPNFQLWILEDRKRLSSVPSRKLNSYLGLSSLCQQSLLLFS